MPSPTLKQQQPPPPPPPPPLLPHQLSYHIHIQQPTQPQQQNSFYNTKNKKLSTKLKSSSLDNEIFLQNRKNNSQNTMDWLLSPHGCATIPRAGSTSSLASTVTASNYQEYKAEIINQGKCLCGQYIRARLRRAGVLNRKATQRLRTILEPSSAVVYEVFPALNSMGEELERMHPRVYTNVSRQLSRAPYGELVDGDAAPMLLNLVAKDLFRSNITWGKIISIFAVCGGFAIDCVRQGHYEYLQLLVDGIAEIIEDDLVPWLVDHGGWLGLQQHIRPHVRRFSFLGLLTLFVAVSSGVYVVTNVAKHIGCHLYSLLF
ncbi:bcl-2-related ovarian killer protein homolog B [Rhagoletis pomonella]|uniref:bcl-2-related ovarian killer protein homolog B n=1 Tax=Rhagoletis pomonella TaxID=28610 RepID=UPI00177B8605|nr:bcl-2-related ovarian killer protein homolog B [Rhagoletis pomonella]XP_036334255.1 bcl-2-related ovarian killer protein homolog B [Rhagoletis pomonella]XP_036334256.1 bcl-2-related ovarian killer protein homolog B [Rhagoletis pomonella]